MANIYSESVKILAENPDEYLKESEVITAILEDANSPVTRSYQEKMYNAVLKKAHIDFGDIPKSAGNIRNYSGYNNMVETLQVIRKLAEEYRSNVVIDYVDTVQKAITNIEGLSSTFQKGFTSKTEYVALEYDTYVYFCVEATTALIYSFVEIVKDPSKQLLDMKIKNTKLRADEFFFEQLKKFNKVQDTMGIDYRKMLEQYCEKGRQNFTGAAVVGVATIMAAALAIVPITREVIYQIYNFRGKLADNLEIQANFLELNKTCVENNTMMDAKRRSKVIEKQTNIAKKMRKLSDTVRVKAASSILDTKRELKKDNSHLSIDNIKDEISNSPFELL